MFISVQIIWLLISALAGALQSPEDDSQDHIGTFQNPGALRRPRYRYWLPDASVDPDLLIDDIVQLGARGAGGIEFLNYFNYGGGEGPAATNWTIYGYATPDYRQVLKAALQAHKDHGMFMDYSMGPQSGQGVPAEPDNPGLAWELVSFNATIGENETYIGQVPGWGYGDLVSAVTFAVVNTTNLSIPAIVIPGEPLYYTVIENTISSDSLIEVTKLISPNGTIQVTASSVSGAESYYLYASYARRSYARACIASSDNPQNILQNGSFAVDHFSTTGAKVTTSFLEDYVLIDGIDELLKEVGHYIWEDSVEIPTYVYWTPDLPTVFEERHGYSMTKYLPLLSGNEGELSAAEGPIRFISDASDQGYGFVSDFRSTMTYLLTTYLGYLNDWSLRKLGLQFSQQVGYNLPVDMLAAIPSVSAPETETLSFRNIIDGFRQFSGPADLAGKSVISIELGADFGQAYYQTWTQLLMEAKHSFVAGVNQVVIHGATYSHEYANTTWPGFTSFDYLFAGQHSRHQPAWDVGYKQAGDYLARCQHVLQTGTPKVDLVFWDKQTAQAAYPTSLYESTDLENVGYTYQYLSPENFDLPAAYVEGGVFAPQQQEFRALILRGNDTLTPGGVEVLTKYAREGLPVILSGGISTIWASSDEDAIHQAENSLSSILQLDNVHQVSYTGLASFIKAIGITPRAEISSNGTWYTRWKEDAEGETYVFIYNDGNFSTGYISFETVGVPYLLDAWTGGKTPIVEYAEQDGRTVIHFALQETETRIVVFSASSKCGNEAEHVVSSSDSVLGYTSTSSGIWAKVAAGDATASVTLSSNETQLLHANPQPAFSLTNWTVVIQQWLPPVNLYDVESLANKVNATFSVPGAVLSSWSDLGLPNASGVGYYTSSFAWPDGKANNTGAYLVIPPVAQGLIVTINGRELPAVDITNPTTDVSEYVVGGKNTVLITISSTLWNSLIPIWEDLLTGGTGPGFTAADSEALGYGPQSYGILGEVQIIPYQLVQIK